VLARLSRPVDDLAVEEMQVPPDEVEDAPVFVSEPDEAGEEAVDRPGTLGAVDSRHHLGHERRPGEAAVDDSSPKTTSTADADVLEVALDERTSLRHSPESLLKAWSAAAVSRPPDQASRRASPERRIRWNGDE